MDETLVGWRLSQLRHQGLVAQPNVRAASRRELFSHPAEVTLHERTVIIMVTGIVIPHETRVAVFEHQFGVLEDYQAAVGGYVEPVYLADAHLTMYANEEGKVRQLPVNRRATCLWWLLHPEMRGHDILVGDVVLIGSTRGHGSTTALPDFLARQLQHTSRFTIEVRTNDDPAHWYDNGRYFDDFFEAAIGAINLQERWSQIRQVRVTPA